MNAMKEVPAQLALDDTDSPCDVIDAMILNEFLLGQQPYSRTVRIPAVRADAPLRPEDGQLLRMAQDEGTRSQLIGGDGWTLKSVKWRGNSAELTVTAVSDELAASVLERATKDAASEPPKAANTAEIGFWLRGHQGRANRSQRTITTPLWTDIQGNYSKSVGGQLERLMAMQADALSGRILLLHGMPGTGKTTALRALAQAWKSWCVVDCVLDPEHLFSDSSYLMQVAVGDDDDEERKWRLLLLEDCDELISNGAKQASGQALSRLLNLTDGLLAQGRDVLVALTTNEPLYKLHPAVIRPGRCLAQIEVGALPQEEARAWLGGTASVGPGGATLAELFALKRGDADPVRTASEPSVGCYL